MVRLSRLSLVTFRSPNFRSQRSLVVISERKLSFCFTPQTEHFAQTKIYPSLKSEVNLINLSTETIIKTDFLLVDNSKCPESFNLVVNSRLVTHPLR